jgi:hypothetical protein
MHQQFRLRLVVVALAVAGVMLGATTRAVAAGPRPDAAPSSAPRAIVESVKVIDKQLVSSSFEGDSTQLELSVGYSNFGTPIPFKCAKACVLAVHAMLQVVEDQDWAICLKVDDYDAVGGCYFQGLSGVVTGNGTFFWSLAAGKHTFQPQIYLIHAGRLNTWAMTLAQYQ